MSKDIKIKYAKEVKWNEYRCPICQARNWTQSKDSTLISFLKVKKVVKVNISDDKKVRPVTNANESANIIGKMVSCNICGNTILRAGKPYEEKEEE